MDKIRENPGTAAAALFSLATGALLWGREWKLLGGALMISGAAAGVYIFRSQSEEKKVKVEEKKVVEEVTTAEMETTVVEVTIEKPKIEQFEEAAKEIRSFLGTKPKRAVMQDYVKKLHTDGLLNCELLKALTAEIGNHPWARPFIDVLARSDVWQEEELRLEANALADPANAVHTALYCNHLKWECKEPISLEAYLLLLTARRTGSLNVHTEVGEDADEKAILATLKRGAQMLCTYERQEKFYEKDANVGWRPWVDLARAYLKHKNGDLTGWEGATEAADAFCRLHGVMTVKQKVVFVPFSRGAKDYQYVRDNLKWCTKGDVGEMYEYLNEEEKAIVDSD